MSPSPVRSLPLVAALLLAALAPVISAPAEVHADVRGVLRVGVVPVSLTPQNDTPVLGSRVEDAVRAYNAAAAAYDRAHGTSMETAPIDRSELGVNSTMLTVSPALEAGSRHLFVRIELPLGFGADHRSYGLGFYPLNVAMPLRRGTVTPYLSAGGSVSWLDDTTVDGEVGALIGARFAGGVRLGRRVNVEVGYGAYVIGGLLDRDQLDTMSDYDPRGAEPPPHPDTALSGGEQRGAVDISLGLAI